MSETRENAPVPNYGQIQDFNAAVLKGLPKIPPYLMQSWIQNPAGLKIALANALVQFSTNADHQLDFWHRFYRQRFPQEYERSGGEKAFRALTLPEEKPGFGYLVVVLKGITNQMVFHTCIALMDCHVVSGMQRTDFGSVYNARETERTYAVWARARQEADSEHRNKSTVEHRNTGRRLITLPERLLMELRYFTENGDHLDQNAVTLCAGSYYREADSIPFCSFRGALRIGTCHKDFADDKTAVREVIA